MILGDAVSKLKTFVWILNHISRSIINLVYVHPKSVILNQMTNLNMVLHILVSVYRLVKMLKLAPVP